MRCRSVLAIAVRAAWGLVLRAQIQTPVTFEALQSIPAAVRDGKQAEVREALDRAAARAEAEADRRSLAHAHVGRAMLAELGGKPDEADAEFERGAVMAAEAEDAGLRGRAALWFASERIRASALARAAFWARMAAREFRGAGDQRQLARALLVLVRAEPAGPERTAAIQEALAAATAGGDARDLAAVQITWGEALRASGNFRDAVAVLRDSSAKLEDLGALAEAGRGYTALGRVYMVHGRERDSMEALRHARSLLDQSGDTPGLMNALKVLGNLLAGTGQRQNAKEALDQVREYAFGSAAPLSVRLNSAGIAWGYVAIGEYEKAIDTGERILREFPERAPASAYWLLSKAYYSAGRYQESIDRATAGIARTKDPEALTNVWAHRWRAVSLDKLGRCDEAADDMLEAVRLTNTIRGRLVPDDESKRAYEVTQEGFADDAVAVLWRAGRKTEALRAAEQFRARAFLDLMASRDSQPGAAAEARTLPSAILASPPSLEALSWVARETRGTILSYWVHPDAVYIWVVDGAGAIHSARVASNEARVNQLTARARRLSYTPDRDAWRQLHQLLIQPVQQWLPKREGARITVLAHSALLQLPFAALLGPTGRYLAEDYALRVVPASGFVTASKEQERRTGTYVMVGAARDMAGKSSRPLPPLAGAGKELDAVAALAPPGSRTLSGLAAREQQLRAEADRASVLHIATHAVVDEADPFASFLALSSRDQLTVSEIYDFRLKADLVVLSACRSGAGKVSADGLLGFTRAFLYAGATSVMAPLWDIPDEPTVRLVQEFYRQYRGGASKSQALRAAQLSLLADLRAGRLTVSTPAGPMTLPEHPALWAGFVLHGGD